MESSADQFIIKFKGKEYDIKSFLHDHPGGTKILQGYRGLNVEEGMAKFNHSTGAYHMLEDFRINSEKDNNNLNDGELIKELVDANLPGRISKNGRIITKMEESRNEEEIRYLEELESRFDWSKPMLEQLYKVQNDYDAWSNSAVYRKMRIFGNPLMECATFTPWWVVPVFWIPIIITLAVSQYLKYVHCYDNCPTNALSMKTYFANMAFGVFLWSIYEYALHRWLFHLNPGKSLRLIQIHFLLHGIHHKVPFDGLRQVFPPLPALLIWVILYAPYHFTNIFPYPVIMTTGGLIGYLTYDMIHYYVHHGSPKDGSYLYAMKRYHSNHHFVNHHKAFGISSKLWDYAFRTVVQLKRLGFSLHWS